MQGNLALIMILISLGSMADLYTKLLLCHLDRPNILNCSFIAVIVTKKKRSVFRCFGHWSQSHSRLLSKYQASNLNEIKLELAKYYKDSEMTAFISERSRNSK